MKTILKLSLILLVFVFTSCEEAVDAVDEITKFDLNYNSEITIPANALINTPIELATPEIASNSAAIFSSNKTSKELVESIKLTEMKLVVNVPASGNFNFLKEITLFINANGLEEKQIAFKNNIANNSSSELLLDIVDNELKDYIESENFGIRISTTTDEAIDEDYDIELISTFFVDAKLLGI